MYFVSLANAKPQILSSGVKSSAYCEKYKYLACAGVGVPGQLQLQLLL